MLSFSPGVSYILSSIVPKLASPPAVLYATSELLQYLGYHAIIPTALRSTAGFTGISVISILLVAVLKGLWTDLTEKMEMRALGAVPIPIVKGKWPGNIDVMLDFIRSFREEYASQFVDDMAVTYGHLYRLRFMGEDLIITMNPKDVKSILTSEFPNWEKGPKFKGQMQSVLGSGVFNSDGDMWKFHRSMTRPFFSREKISDFEIFRRHADHAVDLIRERCSEGEPIDLQDLAGRLTMDSATEFLFGLSVKSMSSPLPLPRTTEPDADGENLFVKAFKRSFEACALRMYIGMQWPLFEMKEDATARSMKVIRDYLDPIVEEALRKKSSGKQAGMDGADDCTLLDYLAASANDATIVRDELLNILLAGRDTTSHSITAILYFLATEDKKILETLREEVLRVAGHSSMPTFEQIQDMKYLRAVINETSRLLPSVPINLRRAVNSTVWTADNGTRYYVPKGVTASWSTIGMQRRTDLWGPDALQFDPERWLDARNKQYYLANPFIFLPFHGGPRICLGQQFALNEASFFIIRILQSFSSISFAPDGFPPGTLPPAEWKSGRGRKPVEKVHPKVHLTMYFSGGLWLRMGETQEGREEL